MRKNLRKILAMMVIIAGVVILFYPFMSEYLFEHRIDSEINTYQEAVHEISSEIYAQMIMDAQTYNKKLTQSKVKLTDPFVETDEASGHMVYEELLSPDRTGIMGYIEIPAISVYLPVFHGTSSATLERGAGHLKGTSLPIGGESTHSVLTGHTGMNKARLFTDLTELEAGDMFFVHVLGNTLAYEIYEIDIVLPEDTSKLGIRQGEDIVTLVTCTPYGINTHRLLVHGKRADCSEEEYEKIIEIGSKETDSQWMRSYQKAIFIGLLITAVLFIIMLLLPKISVKLRGK